MADRRPARKFDREPGRPRSEDEHYEGRRKTHRTEARGFRPTPPVETWSSDLNPEFMAGQNLGMAGPHAEDRAGSALDVKQLRGLLPGIDADDLERIPVLPAGARLEQGASYLDLREPGRGEFTGLAGMEAETDHWYVPKDQVGYELWNRIKEALERIRREAA